MSDKRDVSKSRAVFTLSYPVHAAGAGENVCMGCLCQAIMVDVLKLLIPQHPDDPGAVFRTFMRHAGIAAREFDDALNKDGERPQPLRMIECIPVN